MEDLVLSDSFKEGAEDFFLTLDVIQLGLVNIEERVIAIDDMLYEILNAQDEYGQLDMEIKEEYYSEIFDFDLSIFFNKTELEMAIEYADEHHDTLVKISTVFNDAFETLVELKDEGYQPLALFINKSRNLDIESADAEQYQELKKLADQINVDLLNSARDKIIEYWKLEFDVEDLVGEFDRDYNYGWKPRIY